MSSVGSFLLLIVVDEVLCFVSMDMIDHMDGWDSSLRSKLNRNFAKVFFPSHWFSFCVFIRYFFKMWISQFYAELSLWSCCILVIMSSSVGFNRLIRLLIWCFFLFCWWWWQVHLLIHGIWHLVVLYYFSWLYCSRSNKWLLPLFRILQFLFNYSLFLSSRYGPSPLKSYYFAHSKYVNTEFIFALELNDRKPYPW